MSVKNKVVSLLMKFFALKTADDNVSAERWNVQNITSLKPNDIGTTITFLNNDSINVIESISLIESELKSDKELILLTQFILNVEPDFGFF